MSFDFTAFWVDASREANASREAPLPSGRVPRVFVYHLHAYTPWQDMRDPRYFADSKDPRTGTLSDDPDGGLNVRVFGPIIEHHPGAYTVHKNIGFNLAQIVLWRLAKSKIYLTTNPAEADVFFVPALAAGKLSSEWPAKCRALSDALKHHNASDWLPHLDRTTAHRHFVIFSKEHTTAEDYHCTGWFWRPVGLFYDFMRIAYSHAQPESLRSSSYWEDKNDAPSFLYEDPLGEYPHLHSLPFPSSVHAIVRGPKSAGSPPAWDTTKPRELSMLLVANVDHGTCRRTSPTSCDTCPHTSTRVRARVSPARPAHRRRRGSMAAEGSMHEIGCGPRT